VLSVFHALIGWAGLICSAILALGLASELATAGGTPDPAPPPALVEPSVEAESPIDGEIDLSVVSGESPEALTPEKGTQPGTAPARTPAPPRPHRAPLRRVYRVTAYNDQGITASGRPVGVGQCAAPVDIPFGAQVHIPALGRTFVVTDRTHPRFHHNTVDVFIPSEPLCWKFGRRYLECVIVLPPSRTAHAERH
jgi:3D (Asp-Asp-Asp) domain-containing protein